MQRRLVQNFTFILEWGQGTCSLIKHTQCWAYSQYFFPACCLVHFAAFFLYFLLVSWSVTSDFQSRYSHKKCHKDLLLGQPSLLACLPSCKHFCLHGKKMIYAAKQLVRCVELRGTPRTFISQTSVLITSWTRPHYYPLLSWWNCYNLLENLKKL